jgi:hypothetical protein
VRLADVSVLILSMQTPHFLAPTDKVLLSQGFKAQLALRPRILVCAPSNAATDELLERVMRCGGVLSILAPEAALLW